MISHEPGDTWQEGCWCWSCFKHRKDKFTALVNASNDCKLSELIRFGKECGLQVEIELTAKDKGETINEVMCNGQ